MGNTINKLYLQKAGITLSMFQLGEKYSKYDLDSEAWGFFPHSNEIFVNISLEVEAESHWIQGKYSCLSAHTYTHLYIYFHISHKYESTLSFS